MTLLARAGFAFALAAAFLLACHGGSTRTIPIPADLIIRNARLVEEPGKPRAADSIVIRDRRIVAICWQDETRPHVGFRTKILDAGGGAVVPGLQDAHGHLTGLGAELDRADLRGARSPEEMTARAARFGAEHPDGWLLGRGWDQNLWPGGAFPTRASLDAAIGDRPALLTRVDGHAALASGAALKLAHVTATTPDPDGGKIVRDERGEPTGVLVDRAIELVTLVIPAPTPAAREKLFLAAQDAALAAGLTCVHDAGESEAEQETLRLMDARGQLKLRVYGMAAASAMPTRAVRGHRYELRAVKAYADGALGSRGAALLEPYSDDPTNRGLLVMSEEQLRETAKECMARGLQLCTHAIGDRGNRLTLDVYREALGGDATQRWRIEHCQVVAPEDFARFKDLGVVASMQPTHATSDGPWAASRVGAKRMEGAYAWRRFLELGVPLAFGSDFPVESPDPRLGLFAAVTRRAPEGDGPPFGPSPPLTMREALAAFTSGAAYASFRERELGRLEVGCIADLTVFDRDPFESDDPQDLLRARVIRTIVDGEIVFAQSPGSDLR